MTSVFSWQNSIIHCPAYLIYFYMDIFIFQISHNVYILLLKLESESEVAQSCPTLCDRWTVAHQAPPSMGFSRQEYWSGLPFPSPGDLPDPGIEPRSPTLQADALTSAPPGEPHKTPKLSKMGAFQKKFQMPARWEQLSGRVRH